MILFVAATVREMESFIQEVMPGIVLKGKGTVENYRGMDIGFLICGVGPLNAAISLERYLQENKFTRFVINIGIAGSYDLQSFPLGSICVARREIWPEYGVRSGKYFADPKKLGFPLDKKVHDAVWNSLDLETGPFTDEAGLNFDPGWRRGVSITLAGVSSCHDHTRELKDHFQGDMENMEGFALAYCCHLKSIPFIEIRSISNLAGSRKKSEWDFNGAFAALNAVWSALWEKHHS